MVGLPYACENALPIEKSMKNFFGTPSRHEAFLIGASFPFLLRLGS